MSRRDRRLDKMNDEKIRAAFIKSYLKRVPSDVIILNEVGVSNGAAIVDIAAITENSVEGFEIKSAEDNLSRLPRQIHYYDKTFDFISIVTESKYLDNAAKLVPDHWGIIEVIESEKGVEFSEVRSPKINKKNDKRSISLLLWKREIIAALFNLGHRNLSSLRVGELRSILCKYSDIEIRKILYDHIKLRTDWKDQINL